jgi:resolvase domain protein
MNKEEFLRMGEAAKELNVAVSTLRGYANRGEIECSRTPKGQRVFKRSDIEKFKNERSEEFVFYVRSSKGSNSAKQNQINELTEKFGKPKHIYKDNGSGLSESRRDLQKMIRDAKAGEFGTIYVTHLDRLSRFGVLYLKQLFDEYNVQVVNLYDDKKTYEDELMSDFMSLIASFSGKYYRMRSNENQKKLLKEAEKELN